MIEYVHEVRLMKCKQEHCKVEHYTVVPSPQNRSEKSVHEIPDAHYKFSLLANPFICIIARLPFYGAAYSKNYFDITLNIMKHIISVAGDVVSTCESRSCQFLVLSIYSFSAK